MKGCTLKSEGDLSFQGGAKGSVGAEKSFCSLGCHDSILFHEFFVDTEEQILSRKIFSENFPERDGYLPNLRREILP
jgi:hypothetical protein